MRNGRSDSDGSAGVPLFEFLSDTRDEKPPYCTKKCRITPCNPALFKNYLCNQGHCCNCSLFVLFVPFCMQSLALLVIRDNCFLSSGLVSQKDRVYNFYLTPPPSVICNPSHAVQSTIRSKLTGGHIQTRFASSVIGSSPPSLLSQTPILLPSLS